MTSVHDRVLSRAPSEPTRPATTTRAAEDRDVTPAARVRHAYQVPAFRRYLLATLVSSIGDATWFVALGWGAAQLGDPLLTSTVLAAGTVPRALLLPLGGAVADRIGLRRVMVTGDVSCAILMLCAATVLAAGHTSALLLLVLALVVGLVDAVYLPASSAMPRLLLADDQLSSGIGSLQVIGRLAMPLGAPVGGLFIAQGGMPLVTAVNALTFLVSAGLLMRLRPRRTGAAGADQPSLLRSMSAGFKYVAGSPVLVVVLSAMTVSNMASGPVVAVGIPLRASTEGWGAQGLGWFSACFAIGATVGALAIVRRQPPLQRAGSLGTAWLVVQAVCIILLALSPSLTTTLAAGVATGLTAGPASALLMGLAQGTTAETFQARVMSLVSFAGLGLAPVAFTAFGIVTDLEGVQRTGLYFGCAQLVAAACAFTWFHLHRPRGRHARATGAHPRRQRRSAVADVAAERG